MRLTLRLRLTLAFAAAMAVLLVALGTFAYVRLHDDLLASVDMGLRSRAEVLADAVAAGDDRPLVGASGTLIDPDEAFAQVLDGSGAIVDSSSGVEDSPLLTATEVRSIPGPDFRTSQAAGFDDPVRLLSVPVTRAGGAGVVVVGATLGDMADALQGFLGVMAVVGPAALGGTAIAGWLLAGAALRPVERMRLQAAAVTASEPTRRLPIPPTGDELARLATTLNEMLDRLQEALERERRFVDDASHELRTPLATLRAEIELALARPRPVDELEAALRSAREDVGRLQRLADDLLVLARSRGGRIPLRRVPAPLSDLVGRSVAAVEAEAQAAGVSLAVQAAQGTANLDPDRVQQALRNLLENAIRHSAPGGTVALTAARDDGWVRFAVADSGPGFPSQMLVSAFDPFVRDGSGAGDGPEGAPHAGLGLAIVRAVADAHGGRATAQNTATGARVTLELRER